MIGILANVAMRYTNWSTRICIVPVSHVKDRSIGSLPNTWIQTDQSGARLSDLPNRNPMQYSENIMVDRLLRLDVAPTPDLMQTTPDFWTNVIEGNPTGRRGSNIGDWGVLPRPRSEPPSSPPSPPSPPKRITLPTEPPPPPPQDPAQPVAPAPPVSTAGPGPGSVPVLLVTPGSDPVPVELIPPASGLPRALTPGMPLALVPGSRAGVFVPTEPSLMSSPSRPPRGPSPFKTPERPRQASPDPDTPMSGT